MVEGAGSRRDAGAGAVAGVFAAQSSEMRKIVESAEGWRSGERPGRDGMDDLIRAYYAVSNVMTLAGTLKDTACDDALSGLISDTESFVSRRFDNALHRDAKRVINGMMRDMIGDLTPPSQPSPLRGGAAPAGGAAESEKYARLRKLMSIREFVGQYDAMVRGRAGLYCDTGGGGDGDSVDSGSRAGNSAAASGENAYRNLDGSGAGPRLRKG